MEGGGNWRAGRIKGKDKEARQILNVLSVSTKDAKRRTAVKRNERRKLANKFKDHLHSGLDARCKKRRDKVARQILHVPSLSPYQCF